MTHSIRLSLVALTLLGACSRSSEPALSDDLKRDLAKAGGGDVLLAGAAAPKVDIVSPGERIKSPTPSPKAPAVSRAPSAARGSRGAVRSVRHDTPVAAQPTTRAEEIAPAEQRRAEPAPEQVPAARGRPEAPRPSTQREPPGGWRTPGQIIRNAPFPINP
jgi:hypothetical protein